MDDRAQQDGAGSADAPGRPGIEPRWTSSAKSGVGTALTATSRVWFTMSHGILDEVYWPRADQACTRDLGLVVTDGADYFSEEKRDADAETTWPAGAGVPAFRQLTGCRRGRYRIEKEIIADPRRDVILQRVRFVPLVAGAYRVHVLLAPHLGNRGAGNSAWLGDYKGVPMLFAQRDSLALALACSTGWRARSAGYVGVSDGWQDLSRHRRMTWQYARAADGNVALTGEVALPADGAFVLALAFGPSADDAGHHACASLLQGFDEALSTYTAAWNAWQRTLRPLDGPARPNVYRVSTAVLRTHEEKCFRGGLIASLSIPWGFAKGDEDLGGYHLVWPRDLVECAGALLAAGGAADARRVLHYLHVTQEPDGHWPQNMWLEGTPLWDGVQMDETALPILLVDLAWREGALDREAVARLWPMVRRAAGFIVRNGPVTQQDRWEEDPGYSPFTLGAEISALLAAAQVADAHGDSGVATYLRETADAWYANLDRWIYVRDSDWARELGLDGYYVRISAVETAEAASPLGGFVPIKNRPPEQSVAPAAHVVSPDALALVRFGLRAKDDPRIRNTVRIIDARLRVETPAGPLWRRYDGDGYGEHEDGAPFDGTGVGRAGPLLTGERAHYELAAGRRDDAAALAETMERCAGATGLIPEQTWDAPDIPERELFCGRPAGSAMPLAWAHAEYVKLRRSLADGRVFDLPPQPVQRYLVDRGTSTLAIWRFNHKCRTHPTGKTLRVETLAPALVHWSADGWRTVTDTPTRDTTLGVHVADLPTTGLRAGDRVDFTFYWREPGRWEGSDFAVTIEDEA